MRCASWQKSRHICLLSRIQPGSAWSTPENRNTNMFKCAPYAEFLKCGQNMQCGQMFWIKDNRNLPCTHLDKSRRLKT
jgi:hypothetical protein